jgi:hypothetical protein
MKSNNSQSITGWTGVTIVVENDVLIRFLKRIPFAQWTIYLVSGPMSIVNTSQPMLTGATKANGQAAMSEESN